MTGYRGLSLKEKLLTLAYLPVHLLALTLFAPLLIGRGMLTAPEATLATYAVGSVYMLLCFGNGFRRDFNALCDRKLFCFFQVAGSYLAMIAFNSLLAIIILSLSDGMNPNNEAVMEIAAESSGPVTAAAVFLAPLVEEPIFRAGVFGSLREKSRFAAYAVSMLGFSLYHVVPYAVENPLYLIFSLQYLPISFLLCRCYEKTESIWTPVFLHMLVNGISMGIINLL